MNDTENGLLARLGELIQGLDGDESADNPSPTISQIPNTSENLHTFFTALTTQHTFDPGQLVRWKPGMRDKRGVLEYNETGIVMLPPNPKLKDTENGSGSCYFRAPLDLVVGALDKDGDFMFIHVDSRRLEPWDHQNA